MNDERLDLEHFLSLSVFPNVDLVRYDKHTMKHMDPNHTIPRGVKPHRPSPGHPDKMVEAPGTPAPPPSHPACSTAASCPRIPPGRSQLPARGT